MVDFNIFAYLSVAIVILLFAVFCFRIKELCERRAATRAPADTAPYFRQPFNRNISTQRVQNGPMVGHQETDDSVRVGVVYSIGVRYNRVPLQQPQTETIPPVRLAQPEDLPPTYEEAMRMANR